MKCVISHIPCQKVLIESWAWEFVKYAGTSPEEVNDRIQEARDITYSNIENSPGKTSI